MSRLHLLLTSPALIFLLVTSSSLAQPGSSAKDAIAADLEDQCRELVDRFDETAKLAPYSDEVAAAYRLRNTGASECFRQGDTVYIPYGIEDLRTALRRIEALLPRRSQDAPHSTLACSGEGA
jgi:hypothetical protein